MLVKVTAYKYLKMPPKNKFPSPGENPTYKGQRVCHTFEWLKKQFCSLLTTTQFYFYYCKQLKEFTRL